MKIEIQHGIYDSDFGTFIYRNSEKKMELPYEIKRYIIEKHYDWAKRYPWNRLYEFSIAHDPDFYAWAVTIVHPKAQFKRKTGASIVRGRLKRWLYGKGYPDEEDTSEVDRRPPGLFLLQHEEDISV